jgi:hypothetical protein
VGKRDLLLSHGRKCRKSNSEKVFTTPFGYAFCGWMNNESYDSLPWEIYSYPYIMEVNHVGEILNHYQLPDPPFKGNGRALLYYPLTNTYYLGGRSHTSVTTIRPAITKITNGEIEWRRYYDSFTDDNQIYDINPTFDGGCFAIGTVNFGNASETTKGDVLLMRINPKGNLVFSKTYKWGGGKSSECRFYTNQ